MKSEWLLVVSMGLLGCGKSLPVDYPADAAAAIIQTLSNDVRLSGDVSDAGCRVYDLGSVHISTDLLVTMCFYRKNQLAATCSTLHGEDDGRPGCTVTTAAFGDLWSPRCALRFTFPTPNEASLAKVLTLRSLPCGRLRSDFLISVSGRYTTVGSLPQGRAPVGPQGLLEQRGVCGVGARREGAGRGAAESRTSCDGAAVSDGARGVVCGAARRPECAHASRPCAQR